MRKDLLPILLIRITDSIINAKGKSIIDVLDRSGDENQDRKSGRRSWVIAEALSMLMNIHHALCQEPRNSALSDVLLDLNSRKTVDGLLDLVSLEGIYPCLSPGVSIPIERRVKPVLQGGVVTKASTEDGEEAQDKNLLIKITDSLVQIVANEEATGLRPALYERVLVDLIASLGELAYNPFYTNGKSSLTYAATLKGLVNAYVEFFT